MISRVLEELVLYTRKKSDKDSVRDDFRAERIYPSRRRLEDNLRIELDLSVESISEVRPTFSRVAGKLENNRKAVV